MFSGLPSLFSRSITRVLAVVLVFFLLQQYLYFRKSVSVTQGTLKADAQSCDSLKGLEDVFVILRTGATEAHKKLPVHFSTTLRCVPNYVLYSDYEEDVEGHHVYNALDEINPEIVASHADFEYYRRLQDGGLKAFSTEELAHWAAAKNTNGGRDSPGWRLDKWKFLPLAEKALARKPDAKWYVFIESDTYMLWQTLLEWLSHFDASKPHYLGMQMQIGDVVFAYGGAGFAISNPALNKVVQHRRANLKLYDDLTSVHWAGDCVLGKALKDAGVDLMWSFPTLTGDMPADIDFNTSFGGPDKKPWCFYAASYHHLPPAEYPNFLKFEQSWNQANSYRLRHKDIFRFYLLPRIPTEHEGWDNLSDVDQTEVHTFNDCRSACERQADCLQFSFVGESCKTSTGIRLGHKGSAETEQMKSGWMVDRVKEYTQRMDTTCGNKDWILQ
ncbi:glycosyltransferase family 31 protein [Hypoxylon sp. FL1284]|nr:glycosyltransferase family 31 protein [Hypoxylon sp. FL1284]